MTKFLVTSAIPYVNGVKHLGNLVGSLLPADVHVRFRRQLGDEVLFICGTDEHGTPTNLLPPTRVCRFVNSVTASMPGKPIFISVSGCRSTTSDGRRHRPIMR
jgi:hypothetical protein